MSLILRVDVDKPYGRSNIIKKVASKLSEDYWFPALDSLGYLNHVRRFIHFCDAQSIKGFFYFRSCTAPYNNKLQKLLMQSGHKIGFHAEDTRTMESFIDELDHFKKKTNLQDIGSFTKHGSGMLKLGKHHHPAYEPERYTEWSSKLGIGYYFGNGTCKRGEDLLPRNSFFANMFWIDREYRQPEFFELEQLIDLAKTHDVVVLMHPCNYFATKSVFDDFNRLVDLSRENNINWKIF